MESFVQPHVRAEELDEYLRSGYRHFGYYFFRPVCKGCTRCVPLRIPLREYEHPRSARRLFRKNSDLKVVVRRPMPNGESFELYRKHLNRFDGPGADDYEQYVRSFFAPMNCNYQMSVFDRGRLVSVMHLDVTSSAASAVYCYYNDDLRGRSLGTFAIFRSLELCLQSGLRQFYLGYYVRENRHMCYKGRFKPSEVLTGRGWVPFRNKEGSIVDSSAAEEGFPGRRIRELSTARRRALGDAGRFSRR